MKYLIVGAGPAGVTAAETLRRTDPGGDVVLIGNEPDPPYGRMAIPYFLTGKIGQRGVDLRKDENHWQNLAIEYVQGDVKKVSPGKSSLTLGDGREIAYDKLLLATGSRPVKPPVDGLDLPGVHHCWTMEDARAIAGQIGEGRDVVLMGAGFIGCIIMEALALSGANLTVVEAEDRMVPRMMDQTAGALIKRWCENKKVDVRISARVSSVTRDNGKLSIGLDNGEAIAADLLVVATGVRSNTGFLDGSGVETDLGVRVDKYLKTTVDNIYAAGDVAQGPDFSTGGWNVHAIQPTAVEHGRIAALNMAGKDSAAYRGSLNMNVLDTLGLISFSFGLWQGVEGGDSARRLDEDNFRYTMLQFKDDVMVGAVCLGRTESIGVLRGLIQTPVHLGQWKDKLKADPNLLVEAYIACTGV